MKSWDENNHIQNLPDIYAKSTNSNNYKILATEKHTTDSFKKDISDILLALDIDCATGKTLDLYGEMINQPRGLATDVQYRLMIKSKIMQNVSTGDYPSVIRAICLTFNCDPSEVQITETDNGVEITSLPFDVINSAGLTAGQAVEMINRLLPVCIKIANYVFDGTFELSDSYEEMYADAEIDEEKAKGLTDTYDNMDNPEAVGGYLGFTAGDDNETVLPI